MVDMEKYEVQAYLDYIKSMGIEAWIPDSHAGSSSKMSPLEQCRSKVLCLNYKGSEIYIRGNSRCNEKNDVTSMCFVKESVKFDGRLKNDSINRFNESNSIDMGKFIAKKSSPIVPIDNLKRSVGVQWSIDDTLNIEKDFKKPPGMSKCHENLIKKIEDIDNENLFLKEGVQYKRIIKEKLTKEVRVAKQYVSSLPNKNTYGCLENSEKISDRELKYSTYNGIVEVRKPWPTKGFVRELVNSFTYCNIKK